MYLHHYTNLQQYVPIQTSIIIGAFLNPFWQLQRNPPGMFTHVPLPHRPGVKPHSFISIKKIQFGLNTKLLRIRYRASRVHAYASVHRFISSTFNFCTFKLLINRMRGLWTLVTRTYLPEVFVQSQRRRSEIYKKPITKYFPVQTEQTRLISCL